MKSWFSDIFNQVWTLLGMFSVWIFSEGSGKTVIGYATLGCLLFWIVSFPLRNYNEEEDDK